MIYFRLILTDTHQFWPSIVRGWVGRWKHNVGRWVSWGVRGRKTSTFKTQKQEYFMDCPSHPLHTGKKHHCG